MFVVTIYENYKQWQGPFNKIKENSLDIILQLHTNWESLEVGLVCFTISLVTSRLSSHWQVIELMLVLLFRLSSILVHHR